MARKKKEDPNQISLFDFLGESTNDLQSDNPAGLSGRRTRTERAGVDRDVRSNDESVGADLREESADTHRPLEAEDGQADSRRTNAGTASESGRPAGERGSPQRVARPAHPGSNRGQSSPRRDESTESAGAYLPESVDDAVESPSRQRRTQRTSSEPVAGEELEVAAGGNGTTASQRPSEQGVPDRDGLDASSRLRGEGQSRNDAQLDPVWTNIAAIEAAIAYRDGDSLDDSQRQALEQYRSWGAFSQVFDEHNERYAPARQRLRELLSDDEYTAARRTILTAYYTPPSLTSTIWDSLLTAGYTEGKVLEPGVGAGGFIDAAPEGADVVGIERDPMSALIANARYPESQIRREDFADTSIADNSFVATIGNVPFSQTAPYDPHHNRAGLSTHNYFISKSIDLTAPGGYVAVLTSQHSADSAGRGATSVQQALTDRADFITGVRLPGGSNGAFADFAGTEVGTDVLVFRVRDENQEPSARTEEFCRKQSITVGDTTRSINKFFADNPDHVLGTWKEVSSQFGPTLEVRSDNTDNVADQLGDILRRDISTAVANGQGLTASPETINYAEQLDVSGLIEARREQLQDTLGALRYIDNDDGSVQFQQLNPIGGSGESAWEDVKCAKKYQQEWKAIVDLRNTTEAVLEACREGQEDELPALREVLNTQYDAYASTYGPLNRFTVQAAKEKTPERISADFEKKVDLWRKHNAVDDRPFEGELPDDVTARLWDEAKQPSTREQRKQLHLSGALRRDPYVTAVLALEDFNDDTQQATKGPLFTTNPLRSIDTPTSADSAQDAVVIAQNHNLPMTTATFAELLGNTDEDALARELTENKVAFRHPHRPDEWVPATKYLSGSIYPKLETARQVAHNDPRFLPNVAGLEEALPDKVTSGIKMSLGATWIPDDVYRDFIIDTLDIPASLHNRVTVNNRADEWFVSAPKDWHTREEVDLKWGVRAANANGQYNFNDEEFKDFSHAGIAHSGADATVYSAAKLIEDTMNMRPPQLNMSKYAKLDKGYGENALVVHRKASAFAGSKVEGLEKHFSRWVTQDPERYERLVDVYNRTLNGVVAPSYDGSRREIASISDRYKPYPYQLNAVERMLNEPGVLLNHVVGAGKTGSMLMGAMELKRLGVAKQPWMVVPNHLVEQVGIEAKQWFPGANMLVETRSGSSRKDDRQRLLAQAAANDWELVIVSMSSFGEMSMSADYLRDYRDSVLDEFERDLQEIEDNEVDEQTRRDNTRRIEQKRDKFEQSMNQKIDKISRGDTIPWDQTRGDYIIVDEAHNYKNLRRVSKLADLAEEGSDRATDLDVKLRYLRGEKGSDHPIATFATGTPIANSIAEIYTMLNYLRPDLLHEAGMHGVNSWAQNFTSKRSEIGFTAGNKIKPQTRIASYENLAELAQMCAPMADTITREDIPRKLPSVKGGETTVVEFDVDQETKDLIQDLSWREDNQPDNPKIDNALKIMSDGKNATLSPELANLPPAQGVGRVHAVVQNVVREWRDNKDNEYTDQQGNVSPNRGGLQLIFCDKGVPKPDGSFSMYEAIRDQLVEAGMDKDRIRFIHDWDNKRTQLFDDCNNGKVDVLIANTAKLGTGANIQSRGVAIHHVDVPWRPADLEQQDGRFFRQGNQNDEVARYTYVGRGTYDGHSWATIERKGRFTNQFWNADRSMRSIAPLEDNDLEAMAQNKAIATGNPDFVRKAELTKQVEKLEAAADEHTALAESNVLTRRQAQEDLARAQRRLDRTEGLVDQAEQWADTDSKERTWNINHAQQDSREEATSALIGRLKVVKDSRSTDYQPVGAIAGISFAARFDAINGSVQVKSDFGQVGRDAIEKWVIDPTYAHSGITPEEIKNKQSGLLTQLENTVRAAPDRVDQTRADITNYQQTIDDIDQLGDPESFPHQDQLDSARKELNKVTQRLADFDASDAEVRRRQEYASRLASKGRSPGYSLELNPTGFMRDTGMVCHPDSKPISHAAEGTTLTAPPASPELHPGAQASMDFLDGLGLGGEANNPHNNDYTENSPQTPDEDINLDEEQEDDNGNEL